MTTYGPYPARVVSVHDGDTVSLDISLGFGFYLPCRDLDGRPLLSCRVFGINAPELSTDAGKRALVFAGTLVKPGDRVTVTSHGFDKYGGRFDGTITLADGSDYAQRMLESGNAVPMKG